MLSPTRRIYDPRYRMKQLAALDRKDEFFALNLGLHIAIQKKPGTAVTPRSGPGCFTQSKDDQVLRLHSCRALSP